MASCQERGGGMLKLETTAGMFIENSKNGVGDWRASSFNWEVRSS